MPRSNRRAHRGLGCLGRDLSAESRRTLCNASREGLRTFDEADIALVHLMAFDRHSGRYAASRSRAHGPGARMAVAFAVLNLACRFSSETCRRSQALHFLALACTFAMIVIALDFTGPWITSAGPQKAFLSRGSACTSVAAGCAPAGSRSLPPPSASAGRRKRRRPAVGQMLLLNGRALSGLFIAG